MRLSQRRVRLKARVVDLRVDDQNTFKHNYKKASTKAKKAAVKKPFPAKKKAKPFRSDTRAQQRAALASGDLEVLFG